MKIIHEYMERFVNALDFFKKYGIINIGTRKELLYEQRYMQIQYKSVKRY